jgi:hypothetical protein
MTEVNPQHMKKNPVESNMGEPGEASFPTEAHARSALRQSSMYGGDHAGTTARATKQFPHLSKEHSGVHREVGGKQMKTISEHRREAQGKKLSPRTGNIPAQNNETMGTAAGAPQQSNPQMDGQDVSEDGDENFLDA